MEKSEISSVGTKLEVVWENEHDAKFENSENNETPNEDTKIQRSELLLRDEGSQV